MSPDFALSGEKVPDDSKRSNNYQQYKKVQPRRRSSSPSVNKDKGESVDRKAAGKNVAPLANDADGDYKVIFPTKTGGSPPAPKREKGLNSVNNSVLNSTQKSGTNGRNQRSQTS